MDSTSTKNSQKSRNPPEYPPCKVCGGTGAGKHYGVHTCQSCKTFFRRYLKREKPYVCAGNGDCKVVNSSRGNCSACRAKKCQQVGMSVGGIKIGRRTLKERNKTILEVNELQTEKEKTRTRYEILRSEAQKRLTDLRRDRPYFVNLYPWEINDDQEKINQDECKECKAIGTDDGIVHSENAYINTSRSCNDSHNDNDDDDELLAELLEESDNSLSLSTITDISDDVNDDMDFFSLSPRSLQECFTQFMEWTEEESHLLYQKTETQQLPDDIIQDLVDGFKEIKVHSHLTDDEIMNKIREEYDKMQLMTAAIGPMGVMTNEEYINFFSTTGFDIEGRSKQLRRFTSHVAPFLRRILKFAHKIPGFKTLIPKDRASLIKASKSEVQVLMLNRAVDPDLEMWMVWCGDVLDVNRSWMFGSIENRKTWFSLAKETRDLNLSTEEMAVVMGMSMTFTDRCSLHQPVEVDKINLNLTSYLQTLLQRRYKDTANNQLCKIMKLFVNLRSFSHARDVQIRQFVSNELVKSNFPNVNYVRALFSE